MTVGSRIDRAAIGLAVMLSIASGLAIGYSPRRGIELVGAILALACVAAASAAPRIALVAGVTVMVLPYTWGFHLSQSVVGLGALVGALFIVAFGPTARSYRPSAFDWAVVVFALTPGLTAAFEEHKFHLTQWVVPETLLPYFGFRLLFHVHGGLRRLFPPLVVAAAVPVALIGVWESLSGHNPVVGPGSIVYSATGYTTNWNVPLYRAGHLRALSTFGQPIALGMFLLIPLAFAMNRRGRRYLLAVLLLIAGIAVTYSRGPWIAAVLVVLLLAARNRRRTLVLGLAVALTALLVPTVQHVVTESGASGNEAGNSALYRVGLLSEAWHHLSLFGHPSTNLQTLIPNFADVTSLFAATILRSGLVGLLELGVIIALGFRAYIRARRGWDGDYLAACVALAACFLGMITVTLITNYQIFFWVLVAFIASKEASAATSELAPAPGQANSGFVVSSRRADE